MRKAGLILPRLKSLGFFLFWGVGRGTYRTAVLIAGDHDFVTPVRAAKDDGILVRLYYKQGTVSSELLSLCDDKIEITQAFVDSIKAVPVAASKK